MNVIVFEDHKALNLEPISLTRAVFDIRCGAKTFIERLKELDSIDISALVVRDELVGVTRDNHLGTSVNPDRFDDGIWTTIFPGHWARNQISRELLAGMSTSHIACR